MKPDVVEPMDIISQQESQVVGRIENTPVNKFRLNEFESSFSNGVVEGITFQAQGTADAESVKEVIDDGIVKL